MLGNNYWIRIYLRASLFHKKLHGKYFFFNTALNLLKINVADSQSQLHQINDHFFKRFAAEFMKSTSKEWFSYKIKVTMKILQDYVLYILVDRLSSEYNIFCTTQRQRFRTKEFEIYEHFSCLDLFLNNEIT